MIILLTKGLQIVFFPLIANFFGVSEELESFFVAYSIPAFISAILLVNFGTMFIPLFIQEKVKYGEESAWKFASSLINVILLGILVIVLLGICLSPWIIRTIVPGMASAYKALGVRLVQILFITIILVALTVILSAVLQSYQSFIVPALASLVANSILVVVIIALRERIGVYVLTVAILLSQSSVVFLLLGVSKKFWWNQYTFKIHADSSLIKGALILFIGVSMVGALWQINLIVNRFFASFLPPGNIAVLEYASRSMSLIVELLALSLVVPLYQKMSEESATGDKAKVRDTFSLGIKMTAVVLFPLIAFILFLRFPIFQIFLEHGRFTLQNTRQVSSVFLYLSAASIGSGFGLMITGAYYVLRKLKILLVVSSCGLMLNVLLSAVFYKVMGVEGLALATGAATLLTALFSLGVLNKAIGGLDIIYLARFAGKTLAAALLSGILGWLLFYFMGYWIGMNLLNQIIKLGISAAICLGTYILLMSVLRMGEINFVLDIVKDRIKLIRQFQFFKP